MRKTNKIKPIILVTLLFFGLFSANRVFGAEPITLNLRTGSRGAQVLGLQKFLNQSPATQIASVGAGSPGNETTYFGSRTRKAVIAFQELYAKDVLTPVGLSSGTGYVGPSTRAKINQLLASTTPASPEKISINRVEPNSAAPGQFVSLYGSGFKGGESILIGNTTVWPSTSADSSTLIFAIPNLQTGSYNIAVKHATGLTNQLSLKITSPSAGVGITPAIDNISPSFGRKGTRLAIKGANFDLTSNTVYLSYGTIEDVPSADGKTIFIEVSPDIPKFADNEDGKVRLPFWIYVANKNGLSGNIIFEFIP